MKKINWLHMSDIHYNFDNYDTMVMRDATIRYLKSLQISFNFMTITGDIRYKGESYNDDTTNFIHRILEELQINKDNLFVVPGNHDVKRSPKRTTLIKGIISSENPSDDVNKLDDETYFDLLSGQNEFFEFYKNLTGNDYKKHELHFVENRDDYNIINLNTCLISGIDKEDEQKKLIVGQKKLREALQSLNHDAFNIAIGHHSVECLDSREQERFINTLSDCHIDIYLSGHVHKPSATFGVNNVNNILFISCGSGMCDDFSTVGFITGTLDIESGNGNITFHKWSQKLEKWIKDNEVSRITSDNNMPFIIKKLIKTEDLKKFMATEGYPTAINVPDINVNGFISQLLVKNNLNDIAINYSIRKLPIDIPNIGTNISEREITVNNIIELLAEKTWVHLRGDVWSGKTYLAALVAKKYANNKIWLGLKGNDSEQAYYNIYELLNNLTGVKPSQYLEQFCKDSSAQISQDTLILFDDMPKVFSKLGNFLITFISECKKYNIKIITTGIDEIPVNIKRTIGDTILSCLKVPKFSSNEMLNLLQIYKAPESVLSNEKFVNFIIAKTGGNPSLIRALIYYLSTKEWEFNDEILMDIINEKYSVDFEDEIQDLVIETLSNKYERELLYRLSTVGWSFTFEEVKVLCGISPVIELPLECFNKLINVWVKEEDNATYTVSPLIKKVAEKNIALNTKKSVNLTMANVILKKKILSPIEILRAITHFLEAEEYDNAGLVLINALNEMDILNISTDEWGFSSIWYGMQLPEKMHIETKLYLRVIQVKYCILIEKDIDTLLEDFDNLFNEFNVGFIALYMSVILTLKKPQKANEYFLKSINSISNIQLPNGESIELPKGFHTESLIWMTGSSIKSNEDTTNWINTLEKLSQKQIEGVFTDEIAEQACFNVINCIWLQECKKEKPDWDTILNYFTQLGNWAQEKNQELLWACSIRGRIIVLAEYKENIEVAIKLAEESIKIASNSPLIQFIIKSIMGQQLVYRKKYPDAVNWLTDALSQDTDVYSIEKVGTYFGLSEALTYRDMNESVEYARKAVDFSKKAKDIPRYYIVKVLGEYITALWQADRLMEAYYYFEEAVSILLNEKEDNKNWNEVFTIFGHVSGFVITLLTTGKPPDKTKDGEVYAPPSRRLFIGSNPSIADLYNPQMDFVLAIHTCRFAEVVGLYEKAHYWAIRSYDIGINADDKNLLIMNGLNAGIYLIMENRYKESLNIHLDFSIYYVKTIENQTEKKFTDVISKAFFEEEIPSDIKKHAEEKMLVFWAIPTLMRLSIINLSEPQLASKYAGEIINACAEIRSTSSYQILWDNIFNLFNDIFVETKDFNYFINQCNEISKLQDLWLKVFYYIGAITLSKNPKESLKMHLLCAASIDNEYKMYPLIYKVLFGDYFKLFWVQNLSKYESKFIGVGWKIKHQLEKCNYVSDDTAIKKILGVVMGNLDIKVDDKIMDWLEI